MKNIKLNESHIRTIIREAIDNVINGPQESVIELSENELNELAQMILDYGVEHCEFPDDYHGFWYDDFECCGYSWSVNAVCVDNGSYCVRKGDYYNPPEYADPDYELWIKDIWAYNNNDDEDDNTYLLSDKCLEYLKKHINDMLGN